MKALRRILSRVAHPGADQEQPPGGPASGGPSAAATTTTATTASDAAVPEEGARKRRRRGRRGGRGRGGRAAGATNGAGPGAEAPATRPEQRPPAEDAARSAPAPARPPGGRDGGGGDARRRGSGPVRGLGDRRRRRDRALEAPLPEDVAFRPAAEGGDGSLPVRRRPPPGLRTTNRVILVGGRRYLPAVEAPHRQTPPDEDAAEEPGGGEPDPDGASVVPPEVTPPVEGDEAAEETSRRRRRGRRGGRRHRRSEAPAALAAEDDGPADREIAAPAAEDDGPPDREAAASAAEDDDPPDREAAAPAAEDDGPPDREAAAPAAEEAGLAPRRRPPGEQLAPAFAALGVSEISLGVLAGMGFSDPTPIQERAIPALFARRDVVGVAQTGSGKTLAFALPLVERLEAERREVQAVVLVPTRELAQQVLGVLEQVAAPHGLAVVGLLGGRALAGDFRALEGRPQVVVGTPGRILDHLRRGTLELRRVRYAVLDEADEMLDIGFLPDITRILQRTPRRRQTALFSATMPHAVMRLVRRYMQDPETVSVAEQHDTVETIDQYYVEVAHRDKLRGLRELVERELKGRTLVFLRTRRGVDYVSAQLRGMGVSAGALHGDMDQRRRDQVVRHFRQGELDLLVATNVAARGLDIPEITHVVNFDVPQNAEEYVHRVGRTGRAGRHGTAITLVSEHDLGEFDVLLAVFGDRMREERLELYEPA